MRRPATWSTRLARAALIALVPLTMFVQAAFAHSPPVAQTFRGGVTLTSFSGTFEVIWPSPVYVAGAVIELRDDANAPLLQATEGAAVELDMPCPEFGDLYRCARIRLTDIPALAPGSYVMYWRVVHLDDYVEQRALRFDIDPNWVSPSPVAPSPTPSLSPAPSLPAGTTSPSPVAPTPTPRASASTSLTPPPPSPTLEPSATAVTPERSPAPSGSPTTGSLPGEGATAAHVAAGAIGLVSVVAAVLLVRRRLSR